MLINQESVDAIQNTSSRTAVITGESFESEAVAQNLMRVISTSPNFQNICISNASYQVSNVVINSLISNTKIKMLLLEDLTSDVLTFILEHLSSNNTGVTSLMFKTIRAEDAKDCLDLIAKNVNISTLGLQHHAFTESLLHKLRTIPHVKILGLNAPDINTAQLFVKCEKELANVTSIRITGTNDKAVIKEFVKVFKEKIYSSYSEIKRIITETLDEIAKEKISNPGTVIPSVINPSSEVNDSMKCDTPIAIEKSSLAPNLAVRTKIPEEKKPKLAPIDSNSDNLPLSTSPKISTPLQIFSLLNNVQPQIAEMNEFEWQALTHQKEVEAKYLQQNIKDVSHLQNRYSNLVNKLRNITHPNRKSEHASKSHEIEHDEKNREENAPAKKQKLIPSQENKTHQQYTQATETIEALKSESMAANYATNSIFAELRKEIQEIPRLKIGIYKKAEKNPNSEPPANKILNPSNK